MKNSPLSKLASLCVRSWRVARILLFGHGQLKSFWSRKSVDAEGRPLPWMTYPAIEYLKQFDLSDKHVFEYGSGSSSLFWAGRAKSVIAVELNAEWYRFVNSMRPDNLELLLASDKESYVSSLSRYGRNFDLIVIDGAWRNACAVIAHKFLNESGMIIIDNSDRHYSGSDYLRAQGFFQIDFNGFSPINDYGSTTSLFIKAPAALTLQQGFAKPDPVGGLRERVGSDDSM
jgi:hypothetical protein